MSNSFSAEPSALGYIYQIRYALYRMLQFDDETSAVVESLDDVAFEKDGNPIELLQLKHHINRLPSLTDKCTDLWKSIRIWSDFLLQNTNINLPTLFLVTTSEVSEDSAASYLKSTNRDENIALNKLKSASITSENQDLTKAFSIFNSLNDEQQQVLVNHIYILDNSPDIIDVKNLIMKQIRLNVRPEHINSLYERLEGWWFDKSLQYLCKKLSEPISGLELHMKIIEIAEQFIPDSLPIDFLDYEPPEMIDSQNDTRLFIKQLHEISIDTRRIEKAIRDYYRAFEQRSRWAREELLIDGEIEKYEKKLIDEWERFSLACQDDYGINEADNTKLKEIGRKIYSWMELTANIPIRPRCNEPYIMRGSYHMLADKMPPKVWWHPKFSERLNTLIKFEDET